MLNRRVTGFLIIIFLHTAFLDTELIIPPLSTTVCVSVKKIKRK